MTSQGQTLTADTIYYDHSSGFGEAFGSMVLTDSAHKVEVRGNYGYYDELLDSAFITGRAILKQYSDSDTLWLHGRYIEAFRVISTTEMLPEAETTDSIMTIARIDSIRTDTSHVAVVYPRVRFFRSDLQGVCDSMRYTQADSMLRMFINPVVWNEEQQIFGNVIELHLNDSTIEEAILPDHGFAAQLIEHPHYNQISGKEMKAFFNNSELRRLDINGNVELIMYPEESDSTINKLVTAQSSFLTATFRGRTTEYIKMWPETTGQAIPLFIAKKSSYFLPKFKWFGDMRPTSPEDIFTVPEAMEQVMLEAGRTAPTKTFAPRAKLHQRPSAEVPQPLPDIIPPETSTQSTANQQ